MELLVPAPRKGENNRAYACRVLRMNIMTLRLQPGEPLNENELSVLEGLKAKKAAGEIKKIIVVINYAGMIEGDFLADPDIDAALWVGAMGVGGDAVGQVLSGQVSPSGRLPDTMWVDNAMNPVNVNFGRWIYENADELGVPNELGTGQYPATTLAGYVVYQEGM